MSKQAQHLYEFGPFRLDPAERQLLRAGVPVTLPPKAFETLVVLVERSGHLVEKDELMNALWPDSHVEEANLNHHVWTLRKTLGEAQNGAGYIETVPKRGYRFNAPVKVLPAAAEELVLERHSFTRIITEEEEQTDHQSQPLSLPGQSEKPVWTKWRIAIAAGVLSLLVVVGWLARESRKAETGSTGRPALSSIAVLPFKTLGTEGDNEYLGLGLADALITRLGNVREIVVRPTSAVRRYTEVEQDPVAIGRQQVVDAVLEGNVQRTGDRLRVTAQLIRVADRALLWSGRFDQNFTDIFAVQDSISEQVACDLVTRICGAARARLLKQEKIHIEAYQAYLKGRYFWNKRTRDGFPKAVEYFKQAIEYDPTYARAYAGLGDATYFLGGSDQLMQAESTTKARAWIKKALELDETLSEAHDSLGLIAMNEDWNWAAAEQQFKRAIELSPNYATAHQRYGEFLAYMERFDEAITEVKRAHELDPLSLIISTDVAKVYTLARRYDEAITQYHRALELDPSFEQAHGLLALAYSAKGLHEEAERECHKIEDLANKPAYLSFLGYVYGAAGKRAEAQRVLRQLTELAKQTYVSPYWVTLVYAGLGDKDEAFKWFERVFEERAPAGTVSLKVNPIYDSLRSDPRFADLLRRAGFAP